MLDPVYTPNKYLSGMHTYILTETNTEEPENIHVSV